MAILHELAFLSPAQRRYWYEARPIEEVQDVAHLDIELTDNGYVVRT